MADRAAVGRRRLLPSFFAPLLARATRDVLAQLGQPCLLVSRDDTVRFANASFLETFAGDGRVEGRSRSRIVPSHDSRPSA